MTAPPSLPMPDELPFLEAICWEREDVHRFTPEEALSRYERGWRYRGTLGDLGEEERVYLRRLARTFGSWLHDRV